MRNKKGWRAALSVLCCTLLVSFELAAAQAEHESPELHELEQAVVQRVNDKRREHGLKPLEHHPKLAEIARQYSRRMQREGFFDHVDPQGRTVADRLEQAGLSYSYLGENIAQNENRANPVGAALEGWLASPGHRANILHPKFTQTGVGVWRHNQTYYFTQIFRRP